MAWALPTHTQLLRRQRGVQRKPPGRIYNRARWRRCRRSVLAAHPLCAECERQGRITLATDVDHIIPYDGTGNPYDPANLQPLCHSCHSRKTVICDGGMGNGRRGEGGSFSGS